MSATSSAAQIDDVLNRFQSKLDPTIVNATQEELRQWAEQVQESFDDLHDLLIRHRNRVHDRLFRSARADNADHQMTIAGLKRGDREVQKLLDIVKSQIIVLTVESASPTEPRLSHNDLDQDIVLEFIDRATELVNWIREQEATISDWYETTFRTPA